jgi:5'-deoxynucleotidase
MEQKAADLQVTSADTDVARQYAFMALMFRQRFLPRWNRMSLMESENVLEHTAEVTIGSILLGFIAKHEFGRLIDMGKLLSYAILHDGEETLTTDLPSPIKRSSPEFYAMWKKMEEVNEKLLFSKLPDYMREEIEIICHEKTYESELVKCADVFVAHNKAQRELGMGNVFEFRVAAVKCENVFLEYCEKYPELVKLNEYFGSCMNMSLDELIDA